MQKAGEGGKNTTLWRRNPGTVGMLSRLRVVGDNIRRNRVAGGWARDGAVQDQIDDTIADAVLGARARMPVGESETHCDECGEPIPEGRRKALTGVRTCVACQSMMDAQRVSSGINRRGSKDSQLR